MDKYEYVQKVKKSLDEVIDYTPYDLLKFSSREDEEAFLEKKTQDFDIYKDLLQREEGDGIVVVTESRIYAVTPVFIHDDAFEKIFKFIYEGQKHYCKPDIIEYYNKLGNILIRVRNYNGTLGFDPYIPEKLNDFQIRTLDRFVRELNGVYKELDSMDDDNAKYIGYGIRTIREAIRDNEVTKHKAFNNQG